MAADIQQLLDLARKAGAQQADVYYVESEETPVHFEANRLKSLETKQSRGIGLRVIKDGRLGVASSTDLDNPQFLVDAAIEVAAFGAQAAFELPPPSAPTSVEVYDPAVADLPVDVMVQAGQQLIDAVRDFNPEVLCEARVGKSQAIIRIVTSTGQDVSYRKSSYGLNVEGTLIRGTDMLFVGEGDVSCRHFSDTQWIIDEVVSQLRNAERLASIPSGTYPVIMTVHGVASALIGPMASAFNGRTVLQGASPLVGKIGEQLLDPRLTVIDEPTAPYRPGSAPVDDEGLPTKRRPIVENGTIAGFYYDLQTAGMAGAEPTGNGARSPGTLPSPSLHAVAIQPGDTTQASMIASMDEGLVVELLIGAGQGNVLGGDFGGNVVLGYKVEKGEIVGRVKDTMVSGNVWEALKQVAAIGSEARWVGGSLYTPPLLLDGISVSSKSS